MSKETRNRAKAVNFGIVYGISPFGLAANLNIPQSEAKLYIERYFERYAGVRQYIDRVLEETRTTSRCARCLAGCGRFRIFRAAIRTCVDLPSEPR